MTFEDLVEEAMRMQKVINKITYYPQLNIIDTLAKLQGVSSW
jgi:hypothetical protein